MAAAASTAAATVAEAAAGAAYAAAPRREEGLLLVAVVVMVILALFDLFYSVLYGSVLLERLTSRHIRRRWHLAEVEQYRVRDWAANLQQLRTAARKAALKPV